MQAAARELGYRADGVGRPRSGGRAKVLALAVPMRPGIHVPVVTQFAVSVVTAARARDHDVLLLTQGEGVGSLGRVTETGLADGVIVTDVQLQDARLPLLRSRSVPSVLIGVPAEADGLTCVDLDFRAAGELCVDRLAGLGHRAVALVGSPPEVYVRRTAFARRLVEGFTAAADRHGLASAVLPCGTGRDAARAVVERLLRDLPALTAVVVHNEPLIDPLIEAFGELGMRVPGDLSLIAVCPAPVAAAAASRSPRWPCRRRAGRPRGASAGTEAVRGRRTGHHPAAAPADGAGEHGAARALRLSRAARPCPAGTRRTGSRPGSTPRTPRTARPRSRGRRAGRAPSR